VRYKAAEALFNPDLVGKRVQNLIEAIHAAQYACKAEKRQSLWESIIVTGGSCQIKGTLINIIYKLDALSGLVRVTSAMDFIS
jgi:actin-related protein